MSWGFQIWVATATSGTKHCHLCCILVLFSSVCDWQYLYFHLTSLLFLCSPLALLSSSSTVTFIILSCRYWPRTTLYFLLSLLAEPLPCFLLCMCYSQPASYYINLHLVGFFPFFSFLRTSVLLMHKSLQEGHTDWKPLSRQNGKLLFIIWFRFLEVFNFT